MPRGSRPGKGEGEDVRLSKALSWLLRHGASDESQGVPLSSSGYARLSDVLRHPRFRGRCGVADIRRIVANDGKNRYALRVREASGAQPSGATGSQAARDLAAAEEDPERLEIKANQGHSVQVDDLELTPISRTAEIPGLKASGGLAVHGTYRNVWESNIRVEGLRPMTRNHVHMAVDAIEGIGTAAAKHREIPGIRTSCDVLIYVDVDAAVAGGVTFFLSPNAVVLSPCTISPKYFAKVVDAKTGELLLS